MLSITSVYPYFLLMAFFIFLGSLLNHDRGTPAPIPTKFSVPLESLRGVLAISVFFYHSEVTYFYFKTGKLISPPSDFYLSLGSGPVTLFFFLSGYLFWSKCLSQGGIPHLGRFLSARFKRILPAYYFSSFFVVFGSLLLTRFSLQESLPTLGAEISRWILVGLPLGEFPNINGYAKSMELIGGVVWSLRLEMLFYFALPLMALLSKRHWTLMWLAFFAGLYWSMLKLDPGIEASAPGVFGFLRDIGKYFSLGFCFGMLVAYLKSLSSERIAKALSHRLMGIVVIFFLFLTSYKNSPAYSPRQSFRLVIPFLLIAFDNDVFGLLSSQALVFLGKISYSIYLIHGLMLFMTSNLVNLWIRFQDINPFLFWFFVLISGSLTLISASAIYRWVELPWIKQRSQN